MTRSSVVRTSSLMARSSSIDVSSISWKWDGLEDVVDQFKNPEKLEQVETGLLQ